MGGVNKLSAVGVKKPLKRGRYGDGLGLWLQVSKWDTRSWIFRYMLDGRAREMGLGPVNLEKHDGGVALAEAREMRDGFRKLLRDGIDPIEHRLARRDAQRAQAAERITFKDAAEEFIRVHDPSWKNDKHRQQWRNTLEGYAYGALGNRPVSAIDEALINDALAKIWSEIPETASRVHQRIRRVVKWIADGRPLPKPSKTELVKHHASMPYADIPEFMERLREKDSISARALEFTILTASRSGATRYATWSEIDLPNKLWTIPAGRREAMTPKDERRVPLSERAVKILEEVLREQGSDFVFPGARKWKALTDMAMTQLLRGMGQDITVHGFRTSFKTWAQEQSNFPDAVSEEALWHVKGSKVRKAYARSDLLEKRRHLMGAWARFAETPPGATGKVVPMHKAAS